MAEKAHLTFLTVWRPLSGTLICLFQGGFDMASAKISPFQNMFLHFMAATFHNSVAPAFHLIFTAFLRGRRNFASCQTGSQLFSGGIMITQSFGYFTAVYIPVICQRSLRTVRYADFGASHSTDLSRLKQ